MHPLAEKVLQGDVRATARLLRNIDDRAAGWLEALADLHPHTGNAYVIGITGNPGAGKSTLTDQLIAHYRKQGLRVGVVAVDPTSPFSGGAILGDRIRMQRHALDREVFIRSMATRGQLGGLSRSTADATRVLDAWGAKVVIVETVGVGQDELEIARLAHTTVVVMAPGMGDEVQAIKAGILEVADVFCVNKADRDGADATVRDLEMMVALGHEIVSAGAHSRGHAAGSLDLARAEHRVKAGEWLVPIVKTVASRGEGVTALAEAIAKHRAWEETTADGAERRRGRAARSCVVIFRDMLLDEAHDALAADFDGGGGAAGRACGRPVQRGARAGEALPPMTPPERPRYDVAVPSTPRDHLLRVRLTVRARPRAPRRRDARVGPRELPRPRVRPARRGPPRDRRRRRGRRREGAQGRLGRRARRGAREVVVEYAVYARDLTVRTNHVDESLAWINGASAFLRPTGGEVDWDALPCDLALALPLPVDTWRAYTALELGGRSAGGAPKDYHDLVDSPVLLGPADHRHLHRQRPRPHARGRGPRAPSPTTATASRAT